MQQVEPVLARLADQQGLSQNVYDSLHAYTNGEVFFSDEEVPQVSSSSFCLPHHSTDSPQKRAPEQLEPFCVTFVAGMEG